MIGIRHATTLVFIILQHFDWRPFNVGYCNQKKKTYVTRKRRENPSKSISFNILLANENHSDLPKYVCLFPRITINFILWHNLCNAWYVWYYVHSVSSSNIECGFIMWSYGFFARLLSCLSLANKWKKRTSHITTTYGII